MKLFGKNKKQFVYQSDTQLVKALVAGQQAAFDYVFDRYHELLQSNIKSAFHIKEKDKVEQFFKKHCDELRDFFLVDDCAKLKLFDPKILKFEVWFATVSLTFFKETFYKENTDVVERYREGDKAIVFERFQSSCEQIIRKIGGEESESKGKALLLLEEVHKHLLKDNCKKLNTYKPYQQSFDAWFYTVLHNYYLDQLGKENKFERSVLDSGGFVRINDQDTFPGWEKQIFDIDDNDKLELIEIISKTLETLQPPRYHDILVDLFYKGRGYDEIADSYQITKANAYNLVSRALDRMKTNIEEKYGLRTKR